MSEESRLRAVAELAQGMAAAHGLPGVAHAAASGARAALDGSFAALSVRERDRGRLRVLVNTGVLAADEEEFPADESYPLRGFPGTGEVPHGPPAAERVRTETARGTGPWAAALRRRGRGCCVAAPVVLQSRVWGELYVARGPGARPFGAGEAEFAAVLAAVVAAGMAQHERLSELWRLAFTDPLTGLANRRAVDRRLEEAVERHRATGTVVSLVVCDLNGLKRINDTYGHATGDRLLARFGTLLSRCGAVLPGALAARLGGDEFCLLADGPEAADVIRVAAQVCRGAAGAGLEDGVACGVASTGEPIGPLRSARRLFRLADAAQYRAKEAGSAVPVVAGRAGPGDPAVRMADAPPAAGHERRRFRGTTLPPGAAGGAGAPPS